MAAIFRLLRPLVRLMLRNGLPYGAFAELAKRAYVAVAAEEFGVDGRKQTDSRVAVLTGLTRKEVARVKKLPSYVDDDEAVQRYHRAARVVAAWAREPGFQDLHGGPASLSLEGEGRSFADLVKRHSGDMPVRAVLDELIRVGAVIRLEDGRVQLQARSYVPRAGEVEKLAILGTDVGGLIRTIDYNLDPGGGDPLFQRKVFYDNLPDEALEELKTLTREYGQALIERLDHWMARQDRDLNPEIKGHGRNAAGVGVYYFESPDAVEEAV